MNRDGEENVDEQLKAVFGEDARSEGPLAPSGAGRRLLGVDLRPRLSPEQVTFLLDALSQFGIVSIAGQDLSTFSLAHFERFANHWGALVPHPNNFTRGGKPAQSDGASDGAIEWIPFEKRRVSLVNRAFPGQLACLSHESPTVLVVSNIREDASGPVTVGQGGSWHTDIEYEPLPIYVSMFLVHTMPVSRDAEGGTWVSDPVAADPRNLHPYLEGSDDELIRLRKHLPLNGETSFADTAAAFAALPASEQGDLEQVQLRRRLNEGDEGWLAPLVRTNPRSGIRSFHSPIWASRPRVRPAVEVDGMTMEESRVFLDRLEAHVLQPQFRYDHPHVPGDVTLWDNYMTLHNSPPIKSHITSLDDARLLYRLSCKGEPALTLPRQDAPDWLEAHISGSYTTPPEIVGAS
jgi:alpha-ketoglutarate-dependent taurine dioxygenase